MTADTLFNATSQKILSEMDLSQKIVKPFILVMAGYQGSGKTTLLHAIQKETGMQILYRDRISQLLLERKKNVDDEFLKAREEVFEFLLRKLVSSNVSFAVDFNAIPERLDQIKQILPESGEIEYRVVSVLLRANEDELVSRIRNRKEVPGLYKGTVSEFYKSLEQIGEIDSGVYDLVINTEEASIDQATGVILKKLSEEN